MNDDRLYSFTVRTLYLVALVLNGAVLWDQTRDTEPGRRIRAGLARFRASIAEQIEQARNVRAAESWVVWEAMNILTDQEQTDAD